MAWNCGYCAHLVDNDLSSCPQCGTARRVPASAAADVASGAAASEPAAQLFSDPAPASAHGPEQRDLRMEGHLSAIALWYRIGGIMGLAATSFLLLLVLCGDMGEWRGMGGYNPRLKVILTVALAAFTVFFGGSLLIGRYLNRYSNVARVIAGAFGALGLALNVISTLSTVFQASRGVTPTWMALFSSANLAFGSLWSGAHLWALFNQRAAVICTPGYRALIARKPMEQPKTYSSPFFWLPFVWLGLCFVAAIVFGVLAASFVHTLSQ